MEAKGLMSSKITPHQLNKTTVVPWIIIIIVVTSVRLGAVSLKESYLTSGDCAVFKLFLLWYLQFIVLLLCSCQLSMQE